MIYEYMIYDRYIKYRMILPGSGTKQEDEHEKS